MELPKVYPYFALKNLFAGSTSVETKVEGKEPLTFYIESVINRRLKDRPDPEGVFYILNRFIEHKGKDFAEELYKREELAKEELEKVITRPSLEPLPVEPVHNILDMFDIQEVYDWIKQTGIIKPPSILKDVFDQSMIDNEEGSREQTYLKEDYIWLVALLTILKSTLGPVAEFATLKAGQIPANYKEYILLNFYVGHPIFKTPPFQKLLDYVTKLVNIGLLNEEENSVRLIEKVVSNDDMPYYVLGSVLFQKLLLSSEIFGTDEKHLVSRLYNFVKNKIKLKDIGSSSNIKIKQHTMGGGEDGDSESALETYRVPTTVPPGFVEEFIFIYEDIERLAGQMKMTEHIPVIYEIRSQLETMKNKNIPVENINMVAILMKHIIDPRTIDYIPIDGILNGLAVAITWAMTRGHNDIALLLSGIELEDDSHRLSLSVKTKIDEHLLEKLEERFPYHRGIISKEEVKYTSVVKEWIDSVSKEYPRKNLASVLNSELIEKLSGKKDRIISISPEFKNKLAGFIIDVEDYGKEIYGS